MARRQSTRQERGQVQRDRLRRLVAGAGTSPAYGLDGREDVGRLAAGAAWWSRQDRWGAAIAAPASQITATIRQMGPSAPPPALLFELGRLAFSFSQSLVRTLAGDTAPIFPEPPPAAVAAQAVAGCSCPACQGMTAALTWTEQDLEFLQTSCARCPAAATVSRMPTERPEPWILPRLGTPGSPCVRGLPAATISAGSLDGVPVADGAFRTDPGGVVLPGPTGPATSGSTAPSRLVLLLDLAPIELVWVR